MALHSVIITCDNDCDAVSVLSFAEENSSIESRWTRTETRDGMGLPSPPRRKASISKILTAPRRKASMPRIMIAAHEDGTPTSHRNAEWGASASKPGYKSHSRNCIARLERSIFADRQQRLHPLPPKIPMRLQSSTELHPMEWGHRRQVL